MNQPDFEMQNGVLECYMGSDAHVTVPKGVTEIGDEAFKWCESLKSITIPSSVTRLGERAFEWCESLESITIPDSVTRLGEWAFSECHSLTSIVLPEGVTRLGEWAFYRCLALESITLPDGVTEIGDGAFFECESLTSIVLPEGVTRIGERAFDGCSSLTSIVLPEGVTEIGKDVFVGCLSLKSITIPRKLSYISENRHRYLWVCDENKRLALGFLAHPELYDTETAKEYADHIKSHIEDFKDELGYLPVPTMQALIEKARPSKDVLQSWADLAMKCENTELVAYLMEAIHNTDGEDDPFKKMVL